MKIYVASRFANVDEVRRLYGLLRQDGHEITADWTVHHNVKPYSQNQELATEYAVEDLEGVKNCDVFILLTTEKVGAGSMTEFGAALLSSAIRKTPKIYVVGSHQNTNIFYIHPLVTMKKTIEEVVDELNI
jgi:hypothetical protein